LNGNQYSITQDYIRIRDNTRPGSKLRGPVFLVAHDTGNPGSTARNNRNYFNTMTERSASAHVFIDDTEILEIIPLNEKAWHVRYDVPADNRLYGCNANDAAVGVELCYGGHIHFEKAYRRYVWYFAYLCRNFDLNPRKHIVSHKTLDPGRKVDPDSALATGGKTFEQFINDVCTGMENKNTNQIRETEWWGMKMNLPLETWRQLAGELNRMYHESVDGKIVPPVLNDYTLVEKAYSCEMTPEELLTIMSIIRMRQIY